MNREQFIEKLKNLNITKQDFAEMTGLKYGSVNNWGTTIGNKVVSIPSWVKSYLDHYEKSKKFDYITDEICSKIQAVKNS